MSNRMVAVGVLVAVVALAAYVGIAARKGPPAAGPNTAQADPQPAPPTGPQPLPPVVDVLDIDALLDPPPIPPSEAAPPGVVQIAFEDEPPAAAAPRTPAPATIPPAID